MPLTTEQLTNTLDSMDLLDLGAPGPWDGDLGGHDAADLEWEQILESDTRTNCGSDINQTDARADSWERVAAEIASRSRGSRTPPPPISVDARDYQLAQVNEGAIKPVQPYEEWRIEPQMTRSLFSWREIAYVLIPKGQISHVPWFSESVSPYIYFNP